MLWMHSGHGRTAQSIILCFGWYARAMEMNNALYVSLCQSREQGLCSSHGRVKDHEAFILLRVRDTRLIFILGLRLGLPCFFYVFHCQNIALIKSMNCRTFVAPNSHNRESLVVGSISVASVLPGGKRVSG